MSTRAVHLDNPEAADPLHKPTAADMMADGAKTWRERNVTYGNSYHRHGNVMMALFPHGIKLEDAPSMSRFAILSTIVSKLYRYGHNFHKGGHQDSIHDIGVYAFMLEELDQK